MREFLSKKSYNYYIKNDISEFSLIDMEDSFECQTVNEMIDEDKETNDQQIPVVIRDLNQDIIDTFFPRYSITYILQISRYVFLPI